jgi:hypothetical protein
MAQWLIADISLLDVHAHLWMLPVTGIISLWFLFSLGDAVTPVEAVAKNMRGELAQARRVTFSVAATAAGTRIKSAWRETGSVPAHRPSDPGDPSRLGGPNAIDLKS